MGPLTFLTLTWPGPELNNSNTKSHLFRKYSDLPRDQITSVLKSIINFIHQCILIKQEVFQALTVLLCRVISSSSVLEAGFQHETDSHNEASICKLILA